MMLNKFYVDDLIKTALNEDINYVDVSSDFGLDAESTTTAYYIAKDDGVLCGLDIALRVFELLDDYFTAKVYKHDGDKLKKGDLIADLSGHTVQLLKGERTSLNILQHMSGIASATAKAVELVKGTNASVADTRKTLPGLRPIQKYAVTVGGGKNHRYNLSDAAMLKDNHIDAAGSITKAITNLRNRVGHMCKIEVETRNLSEVKEALDVHADVIMLDNMDYDTMKQAVEMTNGAALLEASGNITLDNIAEVAKTGVDIISLGALTHSVKAFDISMRIK